MNEQIVVRNAGTLSRPRRANTTLVERTMSLLSNKQLQQLALSGGRNLYNYVSKSRPSESKAAKTLLIKDVPMPITKGYEALRRAPATRATKGGGIRVLHRELLDSAITGSTLWSSAVIHSYEINPGLSLTFPWLSTVARNYSEYKIHSLQFEYIPSCPTTTSGDVILSPLYDPQIPLPTSEVQASDQVDAKIGSVFLAHKMSMKASKMNISGTRKLIRDYAMAGSVVNYDAGRFQLSYSGVNPAGVIGKLFVTYDIELFAPRLLRALSTTGWPDNVSRFIMPADQTLATGITYNYGALMSTLSSTANNLNVTWDGTASAYKAPFGIYKVDFTASISSTSASGTGIIYKFLCQFTGCANDEAFYENTITSGSGTNKMIRGTLFWNNTPGSIGGTTNLFNPQLTVTNAGTITLQQATGGAYLSAITFTLL